MADDVKEEILNFSEGGKINFEILTKTIVLEDSIYRETVKRLDTVPDEPTMNDHFMK